MGKAVYDININTPSKEVIDKVYHALSYRSDSLGKVVAFMPSKLPDHPGIPDVGIKNMGYGFTSPSITCDGAYAILTGFDKGASSSEFGMADYASYTCCIYPYRDAYRVYLMGKFVSYSSGGIYGIYAATVKKTVASAGNYDNIYAQWFDGILGRMKENFPSAKQIELSMP